MRQALQNTLLLALLLPVFTAARAQEKLEVEGPTPGAIRLGSAATAAIRIEGRTADPREFKLPVVDGLRLQVSGPSTSSQRFFDGRTLTERKVVQYQLVLQPLREGKFVVPSFTIWTGTRDQATPELRLDARKDLRGEELGWLEIQVEPQRVYVHEPVRIHVEFGVEQGMRLVTDRAQNGQVYLDVEVQAPWLTEFPGGEPIALGNPTGDLRAVVANRQLVAASYEDRHERNGQRWQRFAFDRAFLPTRLGTIELSAPMLRYDVLVREGQQDIFGLRRGQQSDNFYVYGKPLSIEVLPIPEAGRPTPYYGAVGRFSIDAALDNDTVVEGGSVKLTLTVRGQGNFEFLRLPAIDDLEGFHKLGQAEAKRDADKVVVIYDLRVLSKDVKAVPPIRWNWFDTTPGVEKFVEVETKALPLFVKPLANGETLAPLPTTDSKAVTPGVDDVFDLPALDGPPALVAACAPWLGWLAVLGPWLLAFAALGGLLRWRARAADVDGQRARAALRNCLRALDGAGARTDALARYLGDRLGVPDAAMISADAAERLVAAGLDAAVAQEAAALIERGTAARYGGGQGPSADDVRGLAKRLEGARFGVHGWLPVVLLPLLALAALSRPAAAQQAPDTTAAVAAYRAGDYRAAEAAFARAFDATGDRRLWRARGNCFFRLGDLPRALWAYESAALGTPRDAELLANRQLVRTRLELPVDAGGFVAELTALRDRLTPVERLLACALCMAIAAGLFVFGWRRIGLRWIGALVLLPGLWLAVEQLWLAPARPPVGIALQKVAVVSEPRAGLEPIATVRAGVALPVLGGDQGAFVRIAVEGRSGYVPREMVAIVQ